MTHFFYCKQSDLELQTMTYEVSSTSKFVRVYVYHNPYLDYSSTVKCSAHIFMPCNSPGGLYTQHPVENESFCLWEAVDSPL